MDSNRAIHARVAGMVATWIAPVPLPLPGLILLAGIAALRRRV